jgi:predicted DNA-binding WGR domain protein
MLTTFSIDLEARDQAQNLARSYGISAGRDLLGAWVVEVRHGRIGTYGRVRHLAFDDEASARAEIRPCLKRRASAPRRIGAVYRTVPGEGQVWLEGRRK